MNTDLETAKAALRQVFKPRAQQFLEATPAAELARIHEQIATNLADYCANLFPGLSSRPQRVAIYEPMPYELPVAEIVLTIPAFAAAKFVYPGYNATEMWFTRKNELNREIPDFVIVPGLFVDALGNRLGRGKGYYDRFLSASALPRSHRVFLGYPFQFVASVPHDGRDIAVTPIVVA